MKRFCDLETFFIEKSGDEIIGRIDIVVGAAMQEL